MSIVTKALAPFAPWAEIVPGAPPHMTVDDLLAWPDDDGYRYELVEGILVRMAGSGKRATRIGLRIGARLLEYVEANDLGVVTGADGVYKFPGAQTGLLPDAGFYTRARDALIPSEDEDRPIPFAPDLAVEVASPSQGSDAMVAKAGTYLAGGTRLVWVVWPARGQVDVWRPGDVKPTSLGKGETLDGEGVVPGFGLCIVDLFA
jgi:Uma2 family endonuclease